MWPTAISIRTMRPIPGAQFKLFIKLCKHFKRQNYTPIIREALKKILNHQIL